MELGRLS